MAEGWGVEQLNVVAATQSPDVGSSSSSVGYGGVCVCVCVCVYLYTPVHYLGGFSLGIDSTFHCNYHTDPDCSNFIAKCDTFKNHIFPFVILFCNF